MLLASDEYGVEFVVGTEILFVLVEGGGGKAVDVFAHGSVAVQILILTIGFYIYMVNAEMLIIFNVHKEIIIILTFR